MNRTERLRLVFKSMAFDRVSYLFTGAALATGVTGTITATCYAAAGIVQAALIVGGGALLVASAEWITAKAFQRRSQELQMESLADEKDDCDCGLCIDVRTVGPGAWHRIIR